jgi:uncharacterized membrane protein
MSEPTSPTIGPTIGPTTGPAGGTRLASTPRWMKGALLASLALNLLVLGVGAGAAWHARWGQAAGGGQLLGNLIAFTQTFPASRRSELTAANPQLGNTLPTPELRALRQDVRAARREVMRLFTADPFNVEAFRAAETRAMQAEGRMREAMDGLAANLAKQLTAAERTSFLKWRELRRGRAPRADADEEKPPAKAP